MNPLVTKKKKSYFTFLSLYLGSPIKQQHLNSNEYVLESPMVAEFLVKKLKHLQNIFISAKLKFR